MNKIEVSLQELVANSDAYLWQTQQELESISVTLGEVRDMYANSIRDYKKKVSEVMNDAIQSGMKGSPAKEYAESQSWLEYCERAKYEQKIEEMKGYVDAYVERLNTIKKLMESGRKLGG
jgi:hypothetical protein